MAGVRIVTDSTSDISQEEAKELGIIVVPLKVFFGREVFLDGVDLTPSVFFEKLQGSKELPTTSQPTPGEFVEHYQPLVEEGVSIISVHISSQMSGTLQSAQLAKKMLGYEDLEVIDSQTVSASLEIMVRVAARAAKQGKAKEEILAMLDKMKKNQYTYFMVDTLEYLQRGGRIGAARAFLGTVLNVKPVLCIKKGLIHPHEKVRGRKKALNRVVQLVKEKMAGSKAVVCLTHGNDPEALEYLKTRVEAEIDCQEVTVSRMGPVVGSHVGPGVAGVSACSAEIIGL